MAPPILTKSQIELTKIIAERAFVSGARLILNIVEQSKPASQEALQAAFGACWVSILELLENTTPSQLPGCPSCDEAKCE